jgi:uncharacterized protein (TIGR03435 family)
MYAWRCSFLLQLAAFGALCQSFETASIKPADPAANGSSMGGTPGMMKMENVSLKDWIEVAFGLKDFSLVGPAWLESARFNVMAKGPVASTREQISAMLQNLLVERFKLAYHRESKVMPAYALVVDKKGAKLKPSSEGQMGTNTSMGRIARIDAKHVTMADFADSLSQQLDRPVKDLTGITGTYDVKLEWAPDSSAAERENPNAVSIFAALQDQAGLRLEARKLPIDILVVDSIERQPTDN